MPPVEMLSGDGLAAIEENAEEILATVGVAFQEFPEALDLWRQAGARVEGEMVYFPKGMCREIVEKNAPTQKSEAAQCFWRNYAQDSRGTRDGQYVSKRY